MTGVSGKKGEESSSPPSSARKELERKNDGKNVYKTTWDSLYFTLKGGNTKLPVSYY